ncbi:MAG: DUF4350 domain-containing protein [Verrucomicrobiota bacterium]
MLKRRNMVIAAAVALAAGLAFGLWQLFTLRFAVGDVYPPYSSLRSDPLGAKVLFESLDQLRGVQARRLYEPLDKLKTGGPATLFVLGVGARAFNAVPEGDVQDLERFAFDGGRVVLSIYPENIKTWQTKHVEERMEQKREAEEKPRRKKTKQEFDRPKAVKLGERWGFKLDYRDLRLNEEGISEAATAARQAPIASLPESVHWHTAIHFKDPAAEWKILYAREGLPVLMERAFGSGTVVLSADSYFLSNEGLRNDRYPALLAWLLGAGRTVVFDETHLGVNENPGVASLARRYRLHGLVGGLLLLAALFVWKNSASLVPPLDDEAGAGGAAVLGRESAAGFVNMLRRTIAPGQLAAVCLAEWKKSCAQNRSDLAPKVERMHALIEAETRRHEGAPNQVELYRSLARMVKERDSLRSAKAGGAK